MSQKSPFPGMDPFLEFHWRDVHTRLVNGACDQLQEQLPPDLCARMEERVYLADEGGLAIGQGRYPDVRVFETNPAREIFSTESAPVAIAEPEIMPLEMAPETISEAYIEIRDASTQNRVVTVIEFISPSNKASEDGREQYLRKARECRRARVNLVEIDLTREGNRELLLPFVKRLRPPWPTYLASVERQIDPMRREFYRMNLDAPLKSVAIPLRTADHEPILALQSLIEQAYRNGRYWNMNYQKALQPCLPPAEATWVLETLRTAGKL